MPSIITATASSAVTSSTRSEQKSPRNQLQRLAAFVVVLSVGVVAGCASAGHTSRAPAELAGLVVFVRNDSFTDVREYALVGEGSRVRMGSVGAVSQRALTLPSTVLSSYGCGSACHLCEP